jgi:hypothetical protein
MMERLTSKVKNILVTLPMCSQPSVNINKCGFRVKSKYGKNYGNRCLLNSCVLCNFQSDYMIHKYQITTA